MTKAYERYKKWMLANPEKHKKAQLKQQRKLLKFYKRIPGIIKNMEKDLETYNNVKHIIGTHGWTSTIIKRDPSIYFRIRSGYYKNIPYKLGQYKKILEAYERGSEEIIYARRMKNGSNNR